MHAICGSYQERDREENHIEPMEPQVPINWGRLHDSVLCIELCRCHHGKPKSYGATTPEVNYGLPPLSATRDREEKSCQILAFFQILEKFEETWHGRHHPLIWSSCVKFFVLTWSTWRIQEISDDW